MRVKHWLMFGLGVIIVLFIVNRIPQVKSITG